MMPSTTAMPWVKSSTAAKATSAQSGSGLIIWPRACMGVSLERRPVLDRDVKSVPCGVVTWHCVLPSSAAIASFVRWAEALEVLHA